MANLVPTSIASDILASKAKDATRMEEKNMSPGLIFDASSVVRSPGGYLDLITGDQMNLQQTAKLADALNMGEGPLLSEYVDLPELYKASPRTQMVTVNMNPNLLDMGNIGQYQHDFNNIDLAYLPTTGARASVLTHEIQHDLDFKGINNSAMKKAYLEGILQPYTSELERRAYLVEAADSIPDPKRAKQAIFNVMSRGLPKTATRAQDAVLEAAARAQYLEGNSKTVKSKNK